MSQFGGVNQLGFVGDWYFGGFPGAGWGMYQGVAMDQPPVQPKLAKIAAPLDRSLSVSTPYTMDLMAGYGFGFTSAFGLSYDPSPPSSPWLFWWMRKHPAIVLAHAASTLPFLASTRKYEIDDDKGQPKLAKQMADDANKHLLAWLNRAIRPATESMNFGQWLQEVVWGTVDDQTVPIGLNSVLPTEATLHCDRQRQFAGYQIGTEYRDKRYGFLAVEQPHIHPVLGYGRNEAAKNDWWRALQTDISGDKAAIKASGIHMMMSIPKGMTLEGPNGQPMTAPMIANHMANIAASCNVFTVPRFACSLEAIERNPELAKINMVDVKEFNWGDMGPFILSMLSRLDHCYKNMIRSWLHPERESTEGKFGTKAESGTQGQAIGVRDCEATHARLCQQWDDQVTATWRLTNYSKDAPTIKCVAAPLADQQQEFLQGVADALIVDRNTGPLTQTYINKPKLLERVEIPQNTPEEQQVEEAEIKAQQQQEQQTQQANQKVSASADRFEQMGIDKTAVMARLSRRVNGNGRH
jgi:hypothetical protein